jgi:hypothetical protein
MTEAVRKYLELVASEFDVRWRNRARHSRRGGMRIQKWEQRLHDEAQKLLKEEQLDFNAGVQPHHD